MPYQFVDEIVSLALDGVPRIEVAKRFVAGDDVFSGPHDVDCVPESMLLELMAMTAGHLVFRHLAERRLPLLLKVPECRFGASSRGCRASSRSSTTARRCSPCSAPRSRWKTRGSRPAPAIPGASACCWA